jgi:uncharacterized protein YkwD
LKKLRIFILISLIFISIEDSIAEETNLFSKQEQSIIETYQKEIKENLERDNKESYIKHYEYIFNEIIENTADTSEKKVYTYLLESLANQYDIDQDNLDGYNIDTSKVLQTWLDWQNEVRSELGLSSYSYNPLLNNSALKWSQISKERGYMDHRRSK